MVLLMNYKKNSLSLSLLYILSRSIYRHLKLNFMSRYIRCTIDTLIFKRPLEVYNEKSNKFWKLNYLCFVIVILTFHLLDFPLRRIVSPLYLWYSLVSGQFLTILDISSNALPELFCMQIALLAKKSIR